MERLRGEEREAQAAGPEGWGGLRPDTHTHTPPPSPYANHASEHEQATESPERERGRLPLSSSSTTLLAPSSPLC